VEQELITLPEHLSSPPIFSGVHEEEFEDTKGVIRICKSEAGQTTHWSKEKGQKDTQRSTKHTHKTKDRVTRTPLKIGGELRW
jgi:CRISPR/Cas system endoribonuclease Cas6 (RAMP superfamily)